jgi:hypothetical protein
LVNPERSPILRYFHFEDQPDQRKLDSIRDPFANLAEMLENALPNGAEKSTALRKLLESKDAAVRAALDL